MPISEHITEFAGKAIVEWDPKGGISHPAGALQRVAIAYDDAEDGVRWTDRFAEFLEQPGVEKVQGLVIGPWGDVASGDDSAPVLEALVAARDRLPNLRILFFGDITFEECEISWINQTDLSPLFAAYPALQHFCVRGGTGLGLGAMKLPKLRTLIVQSGGLDAEVVRSVAKSDLPALQHLELWLGEENYGASTSVEDLQPILSGRLFPKLRYLGLRDSEIADQIAAAIASAPIIERIRVLDLSMGTLGDEGAQALLACPAAKKLELLDLHHHFMTPAMVKRIKAIGNVDVSDAQDAYEHGDEAWRFVAVGE